MLQETEKLPIDPQLYRETLQQLELQEICIDQLSASCDRDALEGGVVVDLASAATSRQTETKFYAFITYTLTGNRDKARPLRIEATYRLVFDTTIKMPEGFFDLFKQVNLRPSTMPYFRELVASLTGRMELPTLTLPYEILGANKNVPGGQQPAKPTASPKRQIKKSTRNISSDKA